jgi:hypothetical protein
MFTQKEIYMNKAPYNTGKIKIGVYYTPKTYIHMDNDDALVQTVLLNEPATKEPDNMHVFIIVLTLLAVSSAYAVFFS